MKKKYLFLVGLLTLSFVNSFAMKGVNANYSILGPYPIYYETVVPENYAKIVVYATPSKECGGAIILENEDYRCTLATDVTYSTPWYYFIPKGTYTVSSIPSDRWVNSNGQTLNVGSSISYTDSGYISFSKKK